MRDFRQLRVWKDAIDLTLTVYDLAKRLPDSEKFGLKSQMERCGVSVASNIAEGASRRTSLHFAHFLEISVGSCFELETQLIIAKRLEFVTKEDFEKTVLATKRLEKGINALRTAILKTSKT